MKEETAAQAQLVSAKRSEKYADQRLLEAQSDVEEFTNGQLAAQERTRYWQKIVDLEATSF